MIEGKRRAGVRNDLIPKTVNTIAAIEVYKHVYKQFIKYVKFQSLSVLNASFRSYVAYICACTAVINIKQTKTKKNNSYSQNKLLI